jgi:hypothetical protein
MWQDSVRGMAARPWARVVFWLGLGVSVAANVIWYVAVWGWDPVGVAVAAWPAAALLFSVEVVTNPSRRRKVLKATAKGVAEAEKLVRSVIPGTTSAPVQPAAEPPAGDATAATAQTDSGSEARPAGQGTPRQNDRRPVDDEPLPARLVEIAREIGRDHYQRTGQVITRDLLRQRVREQGWPKGFSHVTGGRLLELIRQDIDQTRNSGGNEDQAAVGTAQELAEANHR